MKKNTILSKKTFPESLAIQGFYAAADM